MFIERNGVMYQLEATLYLNSVYVVRKVSSVTTLEKGTVYYLEKEHQEIPIIEGEGMKHFSEIQLTDMDSKTI